VLRCQLILKTLHEAAEARLVDAVRYNLLGQRIVEIPDRCLRVAGDGVPDAREEFIGPCQVRPLWGIGCGSLRECGAELCKHHHTITVCIESAKEPSCLVVRDTDAHAHNRVQKVAPLDSALLPCVEVVECPLDALHSRGQETLYNAATNQLELYLLHGLLRRSGRWRGEVRNRHPWCSRCGWRRRRHVNAVHRDGHPWCWAEVLPPTVDIRSSDSGRRGVCQVSPECERCLQHGVRIVKKRPQRQLGFAKQAERPLVWGTIPELPKGTYRIVKYDNMQASSCLHPSAEMSIDTDGGVVQIIKDWMRPGASLCEVRLVTWDLVEYVRPQLLWPLARRWRKAVDTADL